MATTQSKKKPQSKVLQRAELIAFLAYLLGEARARFERTKAGDMYAAPIAQLYDEVRAMPVAEQAPEDPLPGLLTAHTDLGRALWYGLSSVTSIGEIADEQRAAAVQVLSVLGPRPVAPNTRAETRVRKAALVREDLRSRQNLVARLPAAPAGASFADWLERWDRLAEGLARSVAAQARAEASPPAEGTALGILVQRLNGLIGRARASIRDEVTFNAALPRDLEADLFGLYDRLLAAQRPQSKAARTTEAAAPAPAPAPSEPATP
jgi:hypothetical protein